MIETKFKNSEVGLIPEDWDVKALGILFDMIPNNTLSRECLNYSKGDYQNVHYGDVLIKFSEYVDCEQELLPFINSECKFNKTLLQDGDVVMADTAEDETAGKVTEVVNLDNKKVVSGLHTIPLHPKKKFASKFLGYAMNASSYHKQLYALQSGTKVTSVSKSSIITTKLAFSRNITEQSRIATALSDIDDLIATTKKLIEKKRNIKKGAMQELLSGKRRLPGYTEKWVEKELWEICDRFDNLRVPVTSSLRKEGNTPYYGANGIQDYVEGYTHDGEFILIAEDGANSLTDYPIQYVNGKVWVNNHAHVIKAKEKMTNNKYLSYGLKTIDFESNVDGSTRIKLTASKLMQLKINLPNNVLEQQAIASVLSDMDSEIQSLESRLTKYQSLKQGMMQQLLTGKIRLI